MINRSITERFNCEVIMKYRDKWSNTDTLIIFRDAWKIFLYAFNYYKGGPKFETIKK